MLAQLGGRFPGYRADFVLNPENGPLYGLLREKDAEFETEQQKMVLAGPPPLADGDGVEPLSEKYLPGYLEMHNTDVYWTGERVVEAADRFCSFVALEDGRVAGYVDVTRGFEENEVFDLLVREECRGRGHGRRLMARALEENRPCGMMLTVDVDNRPAIRLYESLGFEKAEGQNSVVAHWSV